MDSLSTKVEKLEKLQDQQKQCSGRNCLLVHGTGDEKEEITGELIINTLNEKLDQDITKLDIKRTYRIREPKKNKELRNKKLKGQNMSITKSLIKIRMNKLRQAKEIYGFTNV